MELKLNRKEVEKIILEWAEQQFKGVFKSVDIRSEYSSFGYAELTSDDPKAED